LTLLATSRKIGPQFGTRFRLGRLGAGGSKFLPLFPLQHRLNPPSVSARRSLPGRHRARNSRPAVLAQRKLTLVQRLVDALAQHGIVEAGHSGSIQCGQLGIVPDLVDHELRQVLPDVGRTASDQCFGCLRGLLPVSSSRLNAVSVKPAAVHGDQPASEWPATQE
jgi:hypothetical protein